MSNTPTTIEGGHGYHSDRPTEAATRLLPPMFEEFRCPTCDGYIPNNAQPGAYMGGLSRRDNQTEICTACEMSEALEDYFDSKERAW